LVTDVDAFFLVDAGFVKLDGSRRGWAVDVELGSADLQVFLSRITLMRGLQKGH
jgi:hypothetical protein